MRGFQSDSKRSPLGINGEGLDPAIASLDEAQRAELEERAGCVSWFKKLDIDEDDRLKLQGFKLGRSASALYFMDKFMPADNKYFRECIVDGAKKTSPRARDRGEKDHDYFDHLSQGFRDGARLAVCAGRNASLGLFVESLAGRGLTR